MDRRQPNTNEKSARFAASLCACYGLGTQSEPRLALLQAIRR